MRCKKAQIQKLQEHIQLLAEQQRHLEDANSELQAHAATLEELVKLRNALVRVLERVCPPDGVQAAARIVQEVPSDEELRVEQQVLELLPSSQPAAAVLGGIDEALYDSIMALTPAKAADYWLERVKEVALAVRLHKRDPVAAQPMLEAAVIASIRWASALHIFNPSVVYALHDFNLVTRRYEPPPPQHWAAVAQAGAFTREQLRAMAVMLSIVRPRLERLEQRKQQLLAEIRSLERGDNSTAARAGTQQTAGGTPHTGWYNGGAAAAPAASRPAGAEQGSSMTDGDDSTSVSSSSSSNRRHEDADDGLDGMVLRLQRRQELVQQLSRNYAAWRTTSQLRAHWVTAACTHNQLALGVLESFPYLLHGAPVFDSSTAVVPCWP